MKSGKGCTGKGQWLPYECQGIDLERHQPLDVLKGVPEDEAGAIQGPEQVAEEGEAASRDTGKQERRTAGLVNSALYRPRLKGRIDFTLDPDQLPLFLQIRHAFLQIAIPHVPTPLSRDTTCLKQHRGQVNC